MPVGKTGLLDTALSDSTRAMDDMINSAITLYCTSNGATCFIFPRKISSEREYMIVASKYFFDLLLIAARGDHSCTGLAEQLDCCTADPSSRAGN